MESSTAIGMMKIGIIELIMCSVLPVITSKAMVQSTDTMATSIDEITSVRLRKEVVHQQKNHQHRCRCRDCHLNEHLDAEGILGHRQTRDEVLLITFLSGDESLQLPVYTKADVLRGQRQINTDGPPSSEIRIPSMVG